MEVVLFGGGGGRGCEYSRGDIYLMEVEFTLGAVEAGDVNTVEVILPLMEICCLGAVEAGDVP